MSLASIRERLKALRDKGWEPQDSTELVSVIMPAELELILAVATAACGIWHGQILHGDMTLLRNEGLRNLADAIDKMEDGS